MEQPGQQRLLTKEEIIQILNGEIAASEIDDDFENMERPVINETRPIAEDFSADGEEDFEDSAEDDFDEADKEINMGEEEAAGSYEGAASGDDNEPYEEDKDNR